MASRPTPRIADWRIADGVRVEELDGTWLALDAAGGVVYRLEALAAEAVRHVAHRMPLPARLVPAARELAGHGVLEHPLVDRRTALVGAGVVTLTGLAATLLPAASAAASLTQWTEPGGTVWPVEGGTFSFASDGTDTYYFHSFTSSGSIVIRDPSAVDDVSILIVGGGGGGGLGREGAGGGGGAGGAMLASGILPQATLSVVVGTGGTGKAGGSSGEGAIGNPSFFGSTNAGDTFSIQSNGGGGGGGPASGQFNGISGGCGGGGAADTGSGAGSGGSVNAITTEAQAITLLGGGSATADLRGFGGGAGLAATTSSNRRAGGGGGVGGAGADGSTGRGDGGVPFDFTDDGFGVFGVSGRFAGGGGGAGGRASASSAAGLGGGSSVTAEKGGAGDGGYGGGENSFAPENSGGDAAANTGSGGGGGVSRRDVTSPNEPRGGNGGSGIVIVRYRLA